MEISREISPVQTAATIDDLKIYVERELSRMQQEIFLLRQFIEPMVKHNQGAPNQAFNPLE